jgi:hypothetical protein
LVENEFGFLSHSNEKGLAFLRLIRLIPSNSLEPQTLAPGTLNDVSIRHPASLDCSLRARRMNAAICQPKANKMERTVKLELARFVN